MNIMRAGFNLAAAFLIVFSHANSQSAFDLYNSGNYSAAFQTILPLAAQGDAAAQEYLATMYFFGRGTTQDRSTAAVWYRVAAEKGRAFSQNQLGFMYQFDMGGLSQSDTQAVSWYRKSAEGGFPLGMSNLAFMYREGRGVPQNYTEAFKWYQKAAQYNEGTGGTAEKNLGYLYENGYGVEKNLTSAMGWYRKAAQQGNKDAIEALERLANITHTAKKRIALLIGNQNYAGSAKLDNPLNDVTLLKSTLESLGFKVTVARDLGNQAFRNTLRTFLNSIDRNTVSFFYFSGHGLEVGGVNYLVPTDFHAQSLAEVDDQAVDIQKLYNAMPAAAVGSDNFVVLDACRDNPFAVTRALGDRGGVKSTGLRVPAIGTNVVTAYAASSGQRASDGVQNSPYVLALVEGLKTPNVGWEDAFKSASRRVREQSGGLQLPTYSNQGDLTFVFNER